MQKLITNKQELVSYLLDKSILLDSNVVEKIDRDCLSSILNIIKEKEKNASNITEEEVLNLINKSYTKKESFSSSNSKYPVKIVYTYRDYNKKREYKDFVKYFNNRYHTLSKILRHRDLPGLVSINKLYNQSHSSDTLSIIGMVYEISETKNGHIILEVEDPTGKTKVLLNKNRDEIISLGKDIVHDEVIAITGVKGEDIFFANQIFFPDVPNNKPLKKSPDEVYAAFISDLQIGSKKFQHEDFMKFIRWLHGEVGDENQKRMGKLTKYLFVVGDIVDGIGIFPGQEDILEILDAYKQYELAAEYMKKIPKDVNIILIPGNHDPLRLADPQPIISKDYGKPLFELPNITFTSSPGMVNIHCGNGFPGFDVLMYHGFSVFYYADKVEKLRNAGGGDRSDLIMKFFLQKRHMAPTHTSNLYIPDIRADPMVIEKVPDIFASGHTHRANAINYKNVTIITGSCWDGVSEYSKKFGGNPLPARVPVINLQTRDVKIIKFTNDY